jgi:hypothetical protein
MPARPFPGTGRYLQRLEAAQRPSTRVSDRPMRCRARSGRRLQERTMRRCWRAWLLPSPTSMYGAASISPCGCRPLNGNHSVMRGRNHVAAGGRRQRRGLGAIRQPSKFTLRRINERSATGLSPANSADLAPPAPLDRPDSQACNGPWKDNHIRCIRSVLP